MLYSTKEVATLLGVSTFTVRRLIKTSQLPALRISKSTYRVDSLELANYVRRIRTVAPIVLPYKVPEGLKCPPSTP